MINNDFKNVKVLYVENEEKIRESAMAYLSRLFENVYEAKDAFEALEIIKESNPDIIITDIKMPKMSGIELIKQIRTFNNEVQIIALSAFTNTKYLLDAIELGLVKYLVKPIRHETFLPVLLQCVKNIKKENKTLKDLGSSYYFDSFDDTLRCNNKIIKLSKNELEFLKLLCTNLNRVVTYEEIENKIWYESVMSEDAIRSLVRNLRRKLPKNCLKNIAKIGYILEVS